MPMLPLVLHVLPFDLARGPQRYARLVRERLDGDGARHRTLTIFASNGARVLDADLKVDAPHGFLARHGFDPRAARRLRGTVRSVNPDVVIAYGSQPFKYLAAALPRATPLIYRKIGVAHAPAKAPLRRSFHAWLMQRASLVAGVSQECLDEAREWFHVPPERLELVPNGRDPNEFFPSSERRTDELVLTFVGHLTPGKRPDLFIKIVSELHQAGLRVRGQLVGDGPERARLETAAKGTPVSLLGRRDDVAQLLRHSDVLLLTALPDGEGMPGVLIEAGLSGLPCIATKVPGATTAIVDGTTGYIVDPGDVATLFARVRSVAMDHAMRAAMGAAGRRHCLKYFTIDRSLACWREVLARTLMSTY